MPITDNYIEDLKGFVNTEQNAQNRQVYEMWDQPLGTRVMEGEAIRGLEIVRRNRNQIVLNCQENLSKFRPGDSLRLNQDDPRNAYYGCEMVEENGNELLVQAGYGVNFDTLQTRSGWALDRDLIDVRQIQLGTLDSIALESQRSAYFRVLLGGGVSPRFDSQKIRRGQELAARLDFNASQTDAFSKAYATDNYYLVQGPPGTGKTWVLAHLAAALANEGQRVLITAFTHRAINNALVKIAKKTQYSHIIKIGQHQYAEDLDYGSGRVNNYNNLQESPFNPNSRGVIIGGTCFAVRTKRLQEMAFDTVIFDEAGQVTLPLAFAGMLAGTKYIFIGDHQQMPPVITAEHKLDWVSKSIFEMLYQYVPGTMLDTTYRMNNAINHFPSHTFYNGKLKTHPNNENGLLKLSRISARYANILDPQQPNIFVEIPHTNRGMRSPEEAEIAARVAVEAVACGVLPEEIAIVAPYRAQGRLIRKLLYEYGRDIPGIMQKIVVDTVERIQGQERDVVIISLTTSDPVHAAKRASFYFQPNRLNVAITRSRMKRIILGSPFLFTTRPDDQRLQKNVDLFYNLYRQSTIIKLPAEQEMELNPGSMA